MGSPQQLEPGTLRTAHCACKVYTLTSFLSSSELTAKGSAYLTETFKDPATALLYDPNHAAFCRAVGINKNTFEWLEDPENERCRRRFGAMMKATATNFESVLDGWCVLPIFSCWPNCPSYCQVRLEVSSGGLCCRGCRWWDWNCDEGSSQSTPTPQVHHPGSTQSRRRWPQGKHGPYFPGLSDCSIRHGRSILLAQSITIKSHSKVRLNLADYRLD
jgi:hypothetical protein